MKWKYGDAFHSSLLEDAIEKMKLTQETQEKAEGLHITLIENEEESSSSEYSNEEVENTISP